VTRALVRRRRTATVPGPFIWMRVVHAKTPE